MAFVPLPLTVLFIASTSESCSSLVFLAAPIFSFFSKRMESPKFGEDKRSLKGNRMEDEDLEEKEEDEDESGEADRKRSSAATRSTKKGESCSGQAPLLLCQAENCSVDMTDAKPYHRRHKVCEFHSKASITMVAGIRQRFCQQCSRFHELSNFDENKRSCRKRLAGHDEWRRRKPKPQNAGFGFFGRPEVNPMKLRSGSDDLQGLGHWGVNSKELKSLANMEEKRQVASIGKYARTDDQVNDIMNLMNIDARDKRMVVVIHGEAGIGKTTLAKLIYSQLSWDFDGCSFLADITETAQELGGLQLLQSKLISDVLKRELEDVTFISRGIDFFRDSFCSMRVLIVLDDVENAFHVEKLTGDGFDCFASGSRILVTTRNSAVLEESPQTRAYHVSRLKKDQALQLLWQHAPGPSLHKIFFIAHDIMAGLPLFIEVMGAVINSTAEERWSQSLKKPVFRQQNFRPILGEVYQILDYKQKQIFLDIACFITGIDSQIAWYLWYDFSLPHSVKFWDGLLTPLAKIGENNQIWMHSMLRQFGREIVSGENLTDPGGHSRIFNPEIALDTIKRKKGTEKVEALCLNFQWHASEKLTAEDFESMPNLRFLQLDHADIAGDFASVFPNLRWLRWRGCPRHLQVTNFQLGNLTILDLSWSKVTKDWEGWDQIEMKNLRVLDLTGCADLLVTPKFSSCQNLAILILERCSQLIEIDHSIGDLKCLASLNLKFCTELSMLPVEVGQLTALKELLMDETSVQEIPISIGYLKQLQTLSASNCFSLSQLSKTICHLTNISLLSLDGTGITALPDSIGELVRLEHLSLRDCYQIRKFPNSIGNIGRSLAELDVSGTGVVRFPHSLKNLHNLKVLKMDSCFFKEFPPDIGELTSLEEIHACWCRNLEGGIPSEIGKLHNLRILRLRHSTISSIPAEIHQLSNLRILDLLHCDMIKELPGLPSSITVLYVDDFIVASAIARKAMPLYED